MILAEIFESCGKFFFALLVNLFTKEDKPGQKPPDFIYCKINLKCHKAMPFDFTLLTYLHFFVALDYRHFWNLEALLAKLIFYRRAVFSLLWEMWFLVYSKLLLKELSLFATTSNFLIPISHHPDGVYLWYFKLRLFESTEFIVWNF